MNKLTFRTLLLSLLCFPLFLTAQGWEKTYDGGADEIVKAADLTLDGGIIIAGIEKDVINNISYSFLYKTDADGVLEWEFYDSIHTGSFVNTLEVFSTSDGNYLMSSIYGSTAPNNEYVVQKIASDGTVLWENSLEGTPYIEYATKISETPQGDYILMGLFDNLVAGGYNVGIVKLNNAGSILWEKGFENDDYPMFSGDMVVAANEDIVFTGYLGYANDSQDNFVKRLDSNGNIIWEQEFDHGENDFALELAELPSGELVIAGSSQGGFGQTLATLQKIDADGNELWYQTYPDLGNNQLRGLELTTDGGFAISGYTSTFSPGFDDFYLMKLDSNGDELWIKNYGRSKDDDNAEVLSAPNSGFYLAGFTQKQDDSYDAYLIRTDSLGISLVNELSGNLFHDENLNCTLDGPEVGLEQWLIEVEQGDIHYLTLTDSLGDYSFTVDTGVYNVAVFPISPYWELCDTAFTVDFGNSIQFITQDIAAQAIIDCPLLDVSIGTPFLRRCFETTYAVQYCNYGTTTAEDAYVDVILDPDMIFLNASITLASQMGDTLSFELGDVELGTCQSFYIDILLGDTVTCDSIDLGATHCVEAHIYPDSICLPTNDWSGASIELDALCQEQGDSVIFLIQNVGSATSQPNLEYIVIEDDVILLIGEFTLEPGETKAVPVLTDGSTYRLEAEQEPNHPGMSMPSVSVEGCGSNNTEFSFGFINVFAQDDGDSFVDIDCRQNIGAFDPNDKMGFPFGYNAEHYIERGQDIEYLIRFQNTGTDTAFNIVVLDTLSEFLDITSVRPGAASHPYDFDITGNGVLNFNFNNIMLPDSNVNYAASNGFVKFKIAQKANLDLETKIYNSAAIYFDFNQPIITNETLHTVGENFIISVNVDQVENPLAKVKVYPNPFSVFANFELEGLEVDRGEFKLYDVTGRIIRKEVFSGNNFTVNKNDLSSGMYFFTIENSGQLIASGKLIAQ